jgi:hypothetical protein
MEREPVAELLDALAEDGQPDLTQVVYIRIRDRSAPGHELVAASLEQDEHRPQ